MDPHQIRRAFEQRFGRPCAAAARAPGRVNLIGEHTDYNDGFVLPVATQQATCIAAAQRDDDRVQVFSQQFRTLESWPAGRWENQPGHWTSYLAGVMAALAQRGIAVGGCDLYIDSDVPTGGGLSSSAALETACALVLLELAGATLSPLEIIDACRQAEHEYAGVPCGLMDQSASLLAREDAALLLDCRSRAIEYIPCRLQGHCFVVVDTGVRHKLAAGEYARRQEQCREAVEVLRKSHPDVCALRDVTPEQLEQSRSAMSDVAFRRARHVISENARTQAAAAALRAGDLAGFGRLMRASHASLRDDYEVSCPELDAVVGLLDQLTGVLGARMTGGGFGGCVVALVSEDALPAVEAALAEGYRTPAGRPAPIVRTRPGPGAAICTR